MYAEERQDAIATAVRVHGRRSVAELASEYDVSQETVRRDLLALERAGFLRRVHGGAVSSQVLPSPERDLWDRDPINAREKFRIADAAAAYLPASGCVLIDAGTTTSRLVQRMPRELRITVVTHALPIAVAVADFPHVDLHVLPGRVRPATLAAVGPETVEALDRVTADVLFLATNAIHRERGLCTPDHDEAATKRALVRSAERVVVLADSSKIGMHSTVKFAELGEVDTLVTDEGISDEHRADLEDAGVEVVVA